MKATIERATLLRCLSHVQSVVERRNTIPILANVLIEAKDEEMRMLATDLEVAAHRRDSQLHEGAARQYERRGQAGQHEQDEQHAAGRQRRRRRPQIVTLDRVECEADKILGRTTVRMNHGNLTLRGQRELEELFPGLTGDLVGLSPRYSFDTFIVGTSNQFAHAACRAVGAPA